MRYHLDYGDQLWAPTLDKGKVRSGIPEDYWTGANYVPVTEILPTLWVVNWSVFGIRQLEKAQKNGRAGGMLVSHRQMTQIQDSLAMAIFTDSGFRVSRVWQELVEKES